MSYSSSNIAVVILAAGSSSRMGKPKQLLKWGKHDLISHTIETVLKIPNSIIFTILGANSTKIKEKINHYPIHILDNENWKNGLGTSISFAANHILKSNYNYDALLFLLADQPLITSDFLCELIQNFEKHKNQIVVTAYRNEKKGVPAVFDAACLEELSELTGDNGAKSIIRKHSNSVKTVTPKFDNLDIDTQDNYKDIYQKTFKNSPF